MPPPSTPVTRELVEISSAAVGIVVPLEDVDWLVAALQEHLISFRPVEALQLGDIDAATVFDAAWHD
jgi:hypothetical protein